MPTSTGQLRSPRKGLVHWQENKQTKTGHLSSTFPIPVCICLCLSSLHGVFARIFYSTDVCFDLFHFLCGKRSQYSKYAKWKNSSEPRCGKGTQTDSGIRMRDTWTRTCGRAPWRVSSSQNGLRIKLLVKVSNGFFTPSQPARLYEGDFIQTSATTTAHRRISLCTDGSVAKGQLGVDFIV